SAQLWRRWRWKRRKKPSRKSDLVLNPKVATKM
ncbi:hypothetical protein NPIL_269501, partial [Nephila pilipes]